MSSVFISLDVYKDDMKRLKRSKVPYKVLSTDGCYTMVQFESKEDYKKAIYAIEGWIQKQ